jgi:hypothetical protein
MARRKRVSVTQGVAGPVQWPQGWAVTYYAKVRKHAAKVLEGRMLCVDPATGATSDPGWALFEAGVKVASGTVSGLRGETPVRLQQLFWQLHGDARFHPLDILVVEQLRGGMVAAQLHWSTGVIVAALPAEVMCEIPIKVWRAVAKADPTWTKGDEADACAFGAAMVAVASGLDRVDGARDVPRGQRSKRKTAGRARGAGRPSNSRRGTKRGKRCAAAGKPRTVAGKRRPGSRSD